MSKEGAAAFTASEARVWGLRVALSRVFGARLVDRMTEVAGGLAASDRDDARTGIGASIFMLVREEVEGSSSTRLIFVRKSSELNEGSALIGLLRFGGCAKGACGGVSFTLLVVLPLVIELVLVSRVKFPKELSPLQSAELVDKSEGSLVIVILSEPWDLFPVWSESWSPRELPRYGGESKW